MKILRHNSKFVRIATISAIVLTGVVLLTYCITLLIPLSWMLITSFKGVIDYATNPFSLPTSWHFENYLKVFSLMNITVKTDKGLFSYNMGTMGLNSLIFSGTTSFLLVTVQTCVAYVVCRYKFVGSKFIYALGIVVMVLPIVGNLPSAMSLYKDLGIYNNTLMFILISPNNIFGLHFLLLYSAFKRIPWALAEAAFIDGAGHLKVMFKIMIPMMIPTCCALFVLTFLNSWNDYMLPMIWLPSFPTLAYGMYMFQYDAVVYGATQPQVLAAFTIVMMPTIIIFLLSQRIIMSKFTVGGLKG